MNLMQACYSSIDDPYSEIWAELLDGEFYPHSEAQIITSGSYDNANLPDNYEFFCTQDYANYFRANCETDEWIKALIFQTNLEINYANSIFTALD